MEVPFVSDNQVCFHGNHHYSFCSVTTAGLDYIDISPVPLQFDEINTVETLIITVIDDSILENDESFFGLLSSDDSAVILSPQQATITIVEDNDGTPHSIALYNNTL